jgi:O-Antigen ligase
MDASRLTSASISAARPRSWQRTGVGPRWATWRRPGICNAVAERGWLALAVLSGCALVFGMLLAGSPRIAVALLAGGCVVILALSAPVTVLLLVLALTALVPYEVQHPLAVGATQSSPGLLPSDALLAAGLLRAALLLPQMPLDRRRAGALGLSICFIAVCAWQAARGISGGANVSVVGAELRHLLGFATLLVAMPILDDPPSRRRLLRGLLMLGLALGLWGLAQWTLHIDFGANGDVGVRQGVALTTSGSGQLQGGLFVYPVAALLAFALLVRGDFTSRAARRLTIAVLVLNCVDLLLTYERTFWIGTLAGAVLICARGGPVARARMLKWTPVAMLVVAGAIVLTPSTFTTAQQRLLSIGQYKSDNSVHYRVLESQHVLARIRAHPLTGSALGATIFWGRPEEGVPPSAWNYSHDGYLWLSWKLGIPGAAVIVALMLLGVLWRGPPDAEPDIVAARLGAQSALLMLLVVSVTFPVFNSLQITSLAGLLLALAAMPMRRGAARAVATSRGSVRASHAGARA